MKKFRLFLLTGIIAFFTGCSKDSAEPDSGGSGGNEPTPTYQIGDYYNRNGVKGVVFKITNGGKHGLIISMDEAHRCQWSTETVEIGANDSYDGSANTALVVSTCVLEKYPAFKWCQDKNVNGVTGWYLPAYFEFSNIKLVMGVINETIANNGGTVISNASYWTSTEDGQFRACAHPTTDNQKDDYFRVRATRAF